MIEISISLMLLVLVLGGTYRLLISGIRSWDHGNEQMEVVENMRIALDYMTREIRAAAAVTDGGSNYIVIKVPNAAFSSQNTVRYALDGEDQELERNSQPVASRIKDLSFSYTGSPIRAVKITLVGVRKDGREVTMNSKVTIRSVSR